MKTEPLILQVNFDGFYLKKERDQDKQFLQLRSKVLVRDKNKCCYCGFSDDPKFMDVINLDGDYKNNKLENLLTVCNLCERCIFVGALGISAQDESCDKIIYLPEMTQEKLNQLVRVLMVAIDSATPLVESATNLYRSLRHRARLVDKMFGEKVSDANVFAQAILDANLVKHKNFAEIMKSLRYLPSRESVKVCVPGWMDRVNAVVPENFSLD